jgi:IrrE N-terminal-like domain
MNASSRRANTDVRIIEAIAALYDAAELDFDLAIPQIVPLDRLIAAYSLRRDELLGLTRRSAIAYIAARSGQDITLPEEADAPLAGFLYAWPYRSAVQGCLLVEQTDIVERRRFSAAHELGHYMLHFRPQIQAERAQGRRLTMAEGLSYRTQADDTETMLTDGALSYKRGTNTWLSALLDDVARMEEEANRFAAELLMPEVACYALVQRFGGRASPRRLATEFLVSEAAMNWRLKNLGLDS